MQEQELFQGYEVKNWDFSPRLYKILVFSAILNVFAIFVLAQTNLLTMKGCDSPLVGGVCQVLDTLYVGGTALSTSKEYVDKEYDPTVLPSADEIVWIPVSDDPFKYPDDYPFSFRQSAQTPVEIPGDGSFPQNIPGIPNPTTGGGGSDLTMQQPNYPQPNNKAVSGKIPSSPYTFSNDENPTIPKSNKSKKQTKNPTDPTTITESPNTLPDLEGKTANNDQKKLPTDDKVSAVVINKKPMQDLAAGVKTKIENKEVDLTQNFKVVAEGVLTKDGKLDTTPDKKTKQPKSRITIKEGNPEMVLIVEQAIAAIGDSGWLGYLRQYDIDKINFIVVQDNDNLQVIITSDLPTSQRANSVSSGLNAIIQGAFFADNNGLKKLGEDEKVLLRSAKVSVNPQNDKQFVLNFLLPKPVAQKMITDKLTEKPEEKPTEQKPNGNNAQVKNSNQKAAK